MWESANIRVHLTGKVAVTIGTQPQGQGHATTVSQVVATELGMPIEDVTVEIGDTLNTPFGYGTYASRSAAVGAVAVYNSLQKIKAKARRIAAHMLEADADDIVFEEGKAVRQGRAGQREDDPGDRRRGRARVRPARGRGAVPRRHDLLRPAELHVPVRHAHRGRRDRPETGEVTLERYIAVDDVGKVINPMIVDGQVHGGIAQGIAQALWEYGLRRERPARDRRT